MTTEYNILIIVVPGVIALMLLGVFSFLYSQTRQAYFRAWQIGWAAYFASYVLLAIYFFKFQTIAPLLAAKLLFAVTIFAIIVSARLVEESFHWRRQDVILGVLTLLWVTWAARFSIHAQPAVFTIGSLQVPAEPSLGFSGALIYSAWNFIKTGRSLQSTAFKLLAVLLIFWAAPF